EVWGRHQLDRGANPDVVFAGASTWGLSENYLRTHAGLRPAAPQAPLAPTAPSAPTAPKAP
ncbi:MAG: hypothetical protein ACO2YV_12340, partial [Pseudomonadales bacterium]